MSPDSPVNVEDLNHMMRVQAMCPKHGTTEYVIESTIPGHEGVWCQLCWLESLGPSLPYIKRKVTES